MVYNRSVVDRVAGLNAGDFAVVPRGDSAPRQQPVRRMVRMYFIGTKVLRNGLPPVINAGGRMIQMPPIGEYLEVPEHVFKDIDMRLRWFEKDDRGQAMPVPAVTESEGVAKAVARAYKETLEAAANLDEADKNKAVQALNVRAMVGEAVVLQTGTQQLMAELRRRREAGEISEDDLLALLGGEPATASEGEPKEDSPKKRNNSKKEGE